MQISSVCLKKKARAKMILKNLLQKKKVDHTLSGYSCATFCSFDKSKTKWSHYRGKDYIEMFCEDLKYQAITIINY